MKKINAFTLAEVLITLGIIGVVSAITISTLIQNYQKQTTVTQLKKAYSELSQFLQKAEVEHGLMETWNFANYGPDLNRTTYFGENYIFPNLKTVKICIPSNTECFNETYKQVNGKEVSMQYYSNGFTGSFVTASGMSVYYWLHSNGTGMVYIVDINGHKKGPNRSGRDIFVFDANWSKNKYMPFGYQNSRDTNTKGKGADACKKGNGFRGYSCAAVIMQDGWKISDDYPW